MKTKTVFTLAIAISSGILRAETIPLYCKDFIVLTETAVLQRDSKIPKEKSLQYLGSDDFMSNHDRKIVRQMIERVYQKRGEAATYHVNQTKKECTTKLKEER